MRDNRPRHALVTGAASGIGRAICMELARSGWTICVADIDSAGGAETVALVERAGGKAEFYKLDVTSEHEWASLRDHLQACWPSIELVVNNAGVCAGGELASTEISTWDWVHAINLRGAMLGCHTFIPWMRENPQDSFLMNMSSIAGLVFSPRMAVYNSTKAALVALSETLHAELKPYNISVTAVCPWFSPTNLLRTGRFAEKAEADYAEGQMATSTVTPEVVAKQGLAATLRKRPVCVVGGTARFLAWLGRWFPSVLRMLIVLWSAKIKKDPIPPAAEAPKPVEVPEEKVS
ncbi:MAG: SDR family NAD(P)-dependent oxidoreductase [Planctomycetaceae bacterium]|nr:SDR family NAD(P)-dependent oxidoreductase [Planctomycetaceae bacterium]